MRIFTRRIFALLAMLFGAMAIVGFIVGPDDQFTLVWGGFVAVSIIADGLMLVGPRKSIFLTLFSVGHVVVFCVLIIYTTQQTMGNQALLPGLEVIAYVFGTVALVISNMIASLAHLMIQLGEDSKPTVFN